MGSSAGRFCASVLPRASSAYLIERLDAGSVTFALAATSPAGATFHSFAAASADVQPRANCLWQVFIVETPVTWRRFLRGWRIFRNREYGDSSAKNFEEVAARQFELMDRSGGKFIALRLDEEFSFDVIHRPCSCIILAAWRTASMMRGCVPQRQILPCKD